MQILKISHKTLITTNFKELKIEREYYRSSLYLQEQFQFSIVILVGNLPQLSNLHHCYWAQKLIL